MPTEQRAALVSGATSSLWFAGTIALTTSHLRSAVSATFLALEGNRSKGAVQLRSRNVGYLVGPAPDLTHPACALIYAWMRCLWRALLSGRLAPNKWRPRWIRRNDTINGPRFQPIAAFMSFRINWESPFQVSSNGRTFNFEPPTAVIGLGPPVRTALRGPVARRFYHHLREYLRDCLATVEALRRTKDFSDLINGFDKKIEVREHTHALPLTF